MTDQKDALYRYWAFLSYSHQDERHAKDLHRWLEAYRVPRWLLGRATAFGPLPHKLCPVFRDREDLSSSPELSDAIHRALLESRYLIVVCSPAAAASRWVNDEIRRFRSMGRADRILALIVAGEPHATDPAMECLPPALREGDNEPIAADLRKGCDSPFVARTKLVSGLMGVRLDELLRRERRRQLQRRLSWISGVLAVLVLGAGALLAQREQFRERQYQEYLVRLIENGRRELLSGASMRAAVYFSEVYRQGVDTPALRFMLAQALQPIDALQRVIDNRIGIWTMKVSDDDTLLAALGRDGVIKLWALQDGALVAQIPAVDSRSVESYSGPYISSDGRQLVFASVEALSRRGQLSVWSTQDGQKRFEVEIDAYNCGLNSPLSADGESVVGIAPGGVATLWSLNGRKTTALGDIAHATVAAFVPESNAVVVGTEAGDIYYRASPEGPSKRLTGLRGPVLTLDFDHDGTRLLASSVTGEVRAWTLPQGHLTFASGHTQRLDRLSYSTHSERFLTSARDGVRVWRTDDGTLLYSAPVGHYSLTSLRGDGEQLVQINQGAVQVVDVDSAHALVRLDTDADDAVPLHDGHRLLAADASGQIAVWDAGFRPLAQRRHGLRVGQAPQNWPNTTDVVTLPGRRAVSGGQDGRLLIWQGEALDSKRVLGELAAPITRVIATPNGRFVAAGTTDGNVAVWSADDGEVVLRARVSERLVSTLLMSPDGRYLFVADRGDEGFLWSVEEATELARYAMDSRFAADISPDGRFLAVPVGGYVEVRELETRKLRLRELLSADEAESSPVGCLRFTPSSDAIAAVAADGGYARWMALHDERRYEGRIGGAAGCFAAEFDPLGEKLLMLMRSRSTVTAWIPDKGEMQQFIGHTAPVYDAEWSRDGRFLVTAGSEGSVKVWDAATSEQLDEIGLHAGAVSTVTLSTDGRLLYTAGGYDGRLQTWSFGSENRTADEIVGRVNCISPWQLDGAALVAKTVDLRSCLPDRPQ